MLITMCESDYVLNKKLLRCDFRGMNYLFDETCQSAKSEASLLFLVNEAEGQEKSKFNFTRSEKLREKLINSLFFFVE